MPDFGYKVPAEEGAEREADSDWTAWLERSRSAVRRYLDPLQSDGAALVSTGMAPVFRRATYWTLACVDHALKKGLGYGLEAFSSAEPPVSKGFPRCLFWPMDQCSSQWAALYFVRYRLRLLIEPLPDPSHRGNNDLVAALKDSHLWESFLTMSIVWSVAYGPWNTSAYHSIGRHTALHCLDDRTRTEPLFVSLPLAIASDRAECHELPEHGYPKRVWDILRTSKATGWGSRGGIFV